MNRERSPLWNLLGLWVFGLIVGANVQKLLPGNSSLPAEVMVAIGITGSVVLFIGLSKTLR